MSDFTLTFGDPLEVSVAVPEGATQISVSIPELNPVVVNNALAVTGSSGAPGEGVEPGGTENQFLQKNSATDYDTKWSEYTLPGADGSSGQALITNGSGAVFFGNPSSSESSDRVELPVRFDEAVSKGDPLYITGYNSGQDRITVAKADAADSSKMPSIGLSSDDYSQNDNGECICIGSLQDVDTQVTNDLQEDDVVYVASGGGLTNVKPTGTNLIQNVGKVGRRQQNNGEIVVMAIGRSNDVPNIPSGQAWIGNASGVATPTTLATIATSGSYSDLSGTPTIPSGDLVDDLTPQLGGDLDVNGQKIVSASDGDIVIEPNGTGNIDLASGAIEFSDNIHGARLEINSDDIRFRSNTVGNMFVMSSGVNSIQSAQPHKFGNPSSVASTTRIAVGGHSAGSKAIQVKNSVDTEQFILSFDGGNNAVMHLDGKFGIGTTSPNEQLHVDGNIELSNGKIVSSSNGDIDIEPNGTGNVLLGNFKFDADQTVGVGQDNHVLTYDHAAGTIGLEASAGGGANMVQDFRAPTNVGEFQDGARLIENAYGTSPSATAGTLVNFGNTAPSAVGAQSVSTAATGMLTVVTDAANGDELLVEGVVKMSSSTGWSASKKGTPLYMSTTPGAVTTTAPSTAGEFVRVVGHVVDGANSTMYFKPDNTWLEI